MFDLAFIKSSIVLDYLIISKRKRGKSSKLSLNFLMFPTPFLTPFSLSLETAGGVRSVLIPRNIKQNIVYIYTHCWCHKHRSWVVFLLQHLALVACRNTGFLSFVLCKWGPPFLCEENSLGSRWSCCLLGA